MAEVKVTKREYFEEIKAIVEAAEVENKTDIVEFIDKQLELLASRAEKAKERAAEKKTAGDKLSAAVLAAVTKNFQTADEIADAVVMDEVAEGEDPIEITKAKVVARLTQLVKTGEVEKEAMKCDGRKLMGYRLVGEVQEVVIDENEVQE